MRLRRTHASIIGAPSGTLASHGLTRPYILLSIPIYIIYVSGVDDGK